MLASRQQMP
jgi:alpha-galactosidase